jgi:hypothetical protein
MNLVYNRNRRPLHNGLIFDFKAIFGADMTTGLFQHFAPVRRKACSQKQKQGQVFTFDTPQREDVNKSLDRNTG